MDMLLFDIETTSLRADYGVVLCAVFKSPGHRARVYRIDEYPQLKDGRWDEAALLKDVSTEFSDGFIVGGYNSLRFDVPFLETRLAFYGLPRLPLCHHADVYRAVRYHFRLSRSSLERVASHILGDRSQKNHVEAAYWSWALVGGEFGKKARDYIVNHCVRDVRVLEDVMAVLKDYIPVVRRRG